ncbi:MAG TPA: hypothetical protein VII29_14790 [Terriglobales bacterium]
MGKAEGEIRAKEGRSPSEESHCPPPNVASDEEENVRSYES